MYSVLSLKVCILLPFLNRECKIKFNFWTKKNTEPTDQYKVSISNLPAQAWVLQSLDSEESPVQFLPPCAGVGWEQDRTLSEVPPPHVFEQEDQAAQSVNPPSTGD